MTLRPFPPPVDTLAATSPDACSPAELASQLREAREQLSRLQQALWASGEAVWRWSHADNTFRFDPFELDGRSRTLDPLDKPRLMERLHPDDIETFRLTWRMHLAGLRDDLDLAFRLRVDGNERWLRARGRALSRDGQGRALEVAGTIKDITAQREAEESLRLMAQAFAGSRDAIVVTDQQWRIQELNPAFAGLYGAEVHALEGQALTGLLTLPPGVDEALRTRGGWSGRLELRAAAQRLLPVQVDITPLSHFTEAGQGHIVTLVDLRRQLEQEARLTQLAHTDALTGLPNRIALEQAVAERLAEGAFAPRPFAVVFVNLEGFREVNDSFGHDCGDRLLRAVAERLVDHAPPPALLGRWGADEFVAVLGPDSGENEVRGFAQGVLATLSLPVALDGQPLSVAAYLGAALAPRDGDDATTLLRRADTAMVQAREPGRNGLAFYDARLDVNAQRLVRLHSLLRSDAERNAFSFVAQPKVDREGRATGVELLMRWSPEAFGPVSPGEFIPMAEKIGLIGLMGRHALHAAAQLAHRSEAAGHALSVAVNLSPRQLLQRGLEQQLQLACRRAGIRPDQLELELTESALVDNLAQVEPLLRRLREAGYSLALDDFGTGFSSLSYLRHLPFHKIKIDRSFVMDIDPDPRAARLLGHMVQLCEALGMSTVAEGVETETQFNKLRELGVQEFQGYHFARPLPIDDWIARLAGAGAEAPRLPA